MGRILRRRGCGPTRQDETPAAHESKVRVLVETVYPKSLRHEPEDSTKHVVDPLQGQEDLINVAGPTTKTQPCTTETNGNP